MKMVRKMICRLHDGRLVDKEVSMNPEEQHPSDSSDLWSVYPLLHLEAEWTAAEQCFFELDVRLIRADKRLLQELRDVSVGPLISAEVLFDDEHPAAQWILAVRVPQAKQPVPAEDIGLDFEEWVEGGVVDSFLACLNVVGSTPATAPFRYRARLCGATLRDVGCCYDYWEDTGDPPLCYWPSAFTDADLPVLSEVWAGIVRVRRLKEWMSKTFDEKTFAELDGQAVKQAREQISRPLLQAAKEQGTATYRDFKETLGQYVRMLQDKKDEQWRDEYRTAFLQAFHEYQDKLFNSESRVGRALGIFESGIHLPPLHAFLSACLVLETLFTVDSTEVAHKMATRLVKMLARGAGLAERRELYRRIKKMYRGRSDVVHGSKSIVALDEEVRKAVLEFAQKALQTILRDEKLVRLYTQDAKGEDGDGGLKQFFEGLDLSGSIGL